MKVPSAGESGRLPDKISHEKQLRDAPISLQQLRDVVAHLESELTDKTPQDKQYIQLHIRQVRGLLTEVDSINMKLEAALSAIKSQGK